MNQCLVDLRVNDPDAACRGPWIGRGAKELVIGQCEEAAAFLRSIVCRIR